MAGYKYTYQKFEPKEMVRTVGINLPISTKISVEIAAFIKGKQIDKAIAYLGQVVAEKKAVPFKKRVSDIPHRKGMRTGRFPRKASVYIVDLLNGLKSNAQNQGFDTSKMIIVHAVAQKGAVVFHQGGQRTKRKNTHFEIVAKQVEETQTKRRLAGSRKTKGFAGIKGKKKQSKRKCLAAPTSIGKEKSAEKKPEEKKDTT